MWDVEKINLGRQPGTEQDADKLGDRIEEIVKNIFKRISYADNKPLANSTEESDPNDGRMRFVD